MSLYRIRNKIDTELEEDDCFDRRSWKIWYDKSNDLKEPIHCNFIVPENKILTLDQVKDLMKDFLRIGYYEFEMGEFKSHLNRMYRKEQRPNPNCIYVSKSIGSANWAVRGTEFVRIPKSLLWPRYPIDRGWPMIWAISHKHLGKGGGSHKQASGGRHIPLWAIGKYNHRKLNVYDQLKLYILEYKANQIVEKLKR